MDSLTHIAMGAALGMATLGRRTALWKAAVWGSVAATLPDLDTFIDHGDPVSNMTLHRADSHGLFWLTLLAPALAWIVTRVHGEQRNFGRWWLALWLALVTHPLLDTLTVYGTQLLRPFSDHPFFIGSIFIIDPLYTLPLLVGVVVALSRREYKGLRWNAGALAFSAAYLAWSVGAQAHVKSLVMASTAGQGVSPGQVLVTPTAFNTVLWRVVIMRDGGYDEGFYSLLDHGRPIRFDRFASDKALARELGPLWPVQRMEWFTHGFYKLREENGEAHITDLRMGQEPSYIFDFVVARRGSDWHAVKPQSAGTRGDARRVLAWMGPRLMGEDLPPPR